MFKSRSRYFGRSSETWRSRSSTIFELRSRSRSWSYFLTIDPFGCCQAEVAKQLGTNVDAEDAALVSARKEFDDKKKALADAFARKARALAELEDISGMRCCCWYYIDGGDVVVVLMLMVSRDACCVMLCCGCCFAVFREHCCRFYLRCWCLVL